jgi:hypothetical protein
MNTRKHLAVAVALVALVLGLTVVPASATTVLKGSFELPAAAYWGNTLLQPGQYTFWMNTEASHLSKVPVVHLVGEGVNLTLLTLARPDRESGRNYLEIDDVNGTYVIRAFDSGLLGERFTFGVTKSVKEHALRASAEPVMTIPVSTGAGY